MEGTTLIEMEWGFLGGKLYFLLLFLRVIRVLEYLPLDLGLNYTLSDLSPSRSTSSSSWGFHTALRERRGFGAVFFTGSVDTPIEYW